jgi:hypothetical protein
VAHNIRLAFEASVAILEAGHAPFVPHLYHFLHCCCPQPTAVWMRLDLRWLQCCHAVLRLPGESPGADREVDAAHQLGIPVYHGLAACLAALPKGFTLHNKRGQDG